VSKGITIPESGGFLFTLFKDLCNHSLLFIVLKSVQPMQQQKKHEIAV